MPFNKTSFLNMMLALLLLSLSQLTLAEDKIEAVTANDPAIDLAVLKIMLVPMTKDELFAEADAWKSLLKTSAEEVATEKLVVKKINDKIQVIEEANAEQEEIPALDQQKIDQLTKNKEKELEILTTLRKERNHTIDHLDTVLAAINEKTGLDAEGNELAEVLPYRRYIDTVGGLKLEVKDTKSAWLSVKGFLLSEEGGIAWAIKAAIFIVTVLFFWFLSKILSTAISKALNFSNSNSTILNTFIIRSVRRVTFIIGLLVAISAIGISVAPILAVMGAAGFIIAFALQSTLSNFASGLMIMFYRPFDVNDVVEVAGIVGKVKSMTLVSTTIMTPDNKLMVVPNNSIWGDVIINAHYSTERRVDMVFGIGYGDDIELASQIMNKVLTKHDLVLEDPAPKIKVSELADSSVNFICRPWCKTADYWDVYWDITRQVKEEFDAAGVSIPFPQTDVHIHQQVQDDMNKDVETETEEEEVKTAKVSVKEQDRAVEIDAGDAD